MILSIYFSVIMSMENVDVPGAGMGPNVTCPARWAPSGPVARTSATATTTPPATPWTGGASASPVSLEPDAKSFALKAIGEKIAIEPANAKMLTLSAIQFTDAFADRDSQVIFKVIFPKYYKNSNKSFTFGCFLADWAVRGVLKIFVI